MDYIDFSLDREDAKIHWSEVGVDGSKGFYSTIHQVFKKTINIPKPEIQLPLLIAYVLTPSAMANRMPLCFLYGDSGTGKSRAGLIAAGLYECEILQGSSTFSSIRNELNDNKYVSHPEDPERLLERNFIMVWDDIEIGRIIPNANDSSMFSMLKSGCNRSTSLSKIAKSNGHSIGFDTFGGKIISSIHPIWDYPGLEELRRRAFPIQFVKTENVDELIDAEMIDLTDVSLEIKHFWFKSEVRETYKYYRKKFLNKRQKNIKEIIVMFSDVLATLSTVEHIKSNNNDAFNFSCELFESYLELRKSLMDTSLLDIIVDDFIKEKNDERILSNEQFEREGLPEFIQNELILESGEVLTFLRSRYSDGSLDINRIDNSIVHKIMKKKKFERRSTSGGLVWVKN